MQVLRLQPGDAITLFGGTLQHAQGAHGDGSDSAPGGEFRATIAQIGRNTVQVVVERHDPVQRESLREIHLAIGMPANERMDWLVEKATELGVSSIQPLMSERSVLRLDAERAARKTAHWNSIAIAACEQCGRNWVPTVHVAQSLVSWSARLGDRQTPVNARLVLSLRPGALPLRQTIADGRMPGCALTLLSGPEGGLSAAEEDRALHQGFAPVSLGQRVLRSETAALVALILLA